MKRNVSKLVYGLFGLCIVLGMFWITSSSAFAQSFLPGFTSSELSTNWGPDRTFPSGDVTSTVAFGRGNVARIGIDSTKTNANTFYRTEGIKSPPGNVGGNFGNVVQVDLYLDSDWQDKAVRAGFWVDDDDGAGNPFTYGVIEFHQSETHTGFRIWNDTSGTWTELNTPFDWDTWVRFQIELDTTAAQYKYYINDVLVGTGPAGTNFIREVFLNSYNYGLDDFATLSSDSYFVHWQNGAPTVQTCTDYQNVNVTPINEVANGLTWSQSRTKGHHEYQADNVRLYTEGTSGQDKVAGYFVLPQSRPLAEIADESLIYIATFGIKPGGQIVIDINNNDQYDPDTDPTLVLEDAYQQPGSDPIYWSRYDFGVGSTISDYKTLATLNKILEKNPDLKFIAYGWSLGSGVYGDGELHEFTAACTHYTFGLEKVTPEEPTISPIAACNTYGSYTLKETEGVEYSVVPDGATQGEITVSAQAKPGYQLVGYTGQWTYQLGTYSLCPAQVVTPIAVQIKNCGMEGDIFYFSTPGVIYTETPDGATEGEVQVTATAEAGYTLVGSDLGPWNFDLGTFNTCVQEVVTKTETVTVTEPITVNIPVTTEVPVTVSQPITINIPVTTEVPVTVSQPVTIQVPVTMEVPVTTTVIVTNSVHFTETVTVTDSVTYVEPGWPTFKDPTCTDPTAEVTLPESDKVAYTVEGESIPGNTVTVRAKLKEDKPNVFLSGTTVWIHVFPPLESLQCGVGNQRLYFPQLSK